MNFQRGYHVPIMAILCDGTYFYFFKFEDRRQTGGAPQFFLGKFPDGEWRQRIAEANPDNPNDPKDFLRQTRLLCESLYYVFLSGYRTGLEAYWNRSVERSKNASRESTPKWHVAKVSAEKALEEAKSAWNLRQENKFEESKISAERAHQFLLER
jgi:hypothetical protein